VRSPHRAYRAYRAMTRFLCRPCGDDARAIAREINTDAPPVAAPTAARILFLHRLAPAVF